MHRVQDAMITVMVWPREGSSLRPSYMGFLWNEQGDEEEINTVLRQCVGSAKQR